MLYGFFFGLFLWFQGLFSARWVVVKRISVGQLAECSLIFFWMEV